VDKHLATTVKGARQLITHKKVLIENNSVNSPSYVVPVDLENKITLKPMKVKQKIKKETMEIENE
jgi:ribosomal protein S4